VQEKEYGEKGKFSPSKPEDIWGIGGRATLILTSALDEGQ